MPMCFSWQQLNFSVFICLAWRCSGPGRCSVSPGTPRFPGGVRSLKLTLCVPHGSRGTAARMQQPWCAVLLLQPMLLFHQLLGAASKESKGLRGPCSLLSCPVGRRQRNVPKMSCPRPSAASAEGGTEPPVSQGGLCRWVTPLGLCPISARPTAQEVAAGIPEESPVPLH